MNGRRALAVAGTAAGLVLLAVGPVWAQAHHPFGVGISEGGGGTTGLTGWLLAQQGWFEQRLSACVRAIRTDGSAGWTLAGLSLAYGVMHAAGPGHGKAVLASYMVANERALRRGIALSVLAALLQGLVAILLVGVLALLLHATAQRMKDAASLVEILSFAGIAALGAWLVWRKGRALFVAWRVRRQATGGAAGFVAGGRVPLAPSNRAGFGPRAVVGSNGSRFACVATDATHDQGCLHCAAVDPAPLAGEAFSWRTAAVTVLAAGSRPCSGAILVLVFALAQGVFAAGVAAVLAMAFGVAITTAALASLAVLAKSVALRFAGPNTRGAGLLVAILELGAAVLVLVAGLGLLLGTVSVGGA